MIVFEDIGETLLRLIESLEDRGELLARGEPARDEERLSALEAARYKALADRPQKGVLCPVADRGGVGIRDDRARGLDFIFKERREARYHRRELFARDRAVRIERRCRHALDDAFVFCPDNG